MAYKFQLGTAKLSGSIEQVGPSDDTAALRSVTVDTGATIGCDADSNLLTLANQSITVASDASLTYKGTAITATGAELNYLDGADSSIQSLQLPDNTTISAYGATLVDDANAGAARTTLGLGSIATQNSGSVTIEGGSVTGITDLLVADGGTGASNAAGARTNLGLVIGTDVQAQNAILQDIAGLTQAANKGVFFDTNSTAATFDLTAAGRALLDDADAAAQRTTLGLGSMAEQAHGSVNIDGGAIDGVTIGTNSAVTQLTASNALITNLDVVTINSVSQTETTLEIDDKKIVSALSASSANASGGGLQIGGGANAGAVEGHASVLWDHANAALDFNIGTETQLLLKNGFLMPASDNDIELGGESAAYKKLYLKGGGLVLAGSSVSAAASELNLLDAGAGSSTSVAGSDGIIIFDADDGGENHRAKKVLVSDIVTTAGRLNVEDQSSFTNGDTLSVGLNFFADLTGTNGEVNLPTSGNSSEGDVIYVKAGDLDASSDIVIMANTGQNIDGAAAIALESPFAAVTLVYVSTNNWRIV